MNLDRVRDETRASAERPAALAAHVRLFTGVRPPVHFQIALARERPAAQVARERRLARVRPHVHGQVAPVRERVAAHAARVALADRMHATVLGHAVGGRERLAALVAHARGGRVARVHPAPVLFQAVGLDERAAARVARVPFPGRAAPPGRLVARVRVRPAVLGQAAVPRVRLAAHVARASPVAVTGQQAPRLVRVAAHVARDRRRARVRPPVLDQMTAPAERFPAHVAPESPPVVVRRSRRSPQYFPVLQRVAQPQRNDRDVFGSVNKKHSLRFGSTGLKHVDVMILSFLHRVIVGLGTYMASFSMIVPPNQCRRLFRSTAGSFKAIFSVLHLFRMYVSALCCYI